MILNKYLMKYLGMTTGVRKCLFVLQTGISSADLCLDSRPIYCFWLHLIPMFTQG